MLAVCIGDRFVDTERIEKPLSCVDGAEHLFLNGHSCEMASGLSSSCEKGTEGADNSSDIVFPLGDGERAVLLIYYLELERRKSNCTGLSRENGTPLQDSRLVQRFESELGFGFYKHSLWLIDAVGWD